MTSKLTIDTCKISFFKFHWHCKSGFRFERRRFAYRSSSLPDIFTLQRHRFHSWVVDKKLLRIVISGSLHNQPQWRNLTRTVITRALCSAFIQFDSCIFLKLHKATNSRIIITLVFVITDFILEQLKRGTAKFEIVTQQHPLQLQSTNSRFFARIGGFMNPKIKYSFGFIDFIWWLTVKVLILSICQ